MTRLQDAKLLLTGLDGGAVVGGGGVVGGVVGDGGGEVGSIV